MAESEVDSLLIALAQRCGGIEPLLESLFSFLKRKTDFYHVMQPGDKIGFPEGKAERLVLTAYRKFLKAEADISPSKEALEKCAQRLHAPTSQGNQSQQRPEPPPPKPGAPGPEPPAVTKPARDEKKESSGKPTTSSEHQPSATRPASDPKPADDGGNGFVPYNGGVCDRYRWSQTIDDITLYIDVAGPTGPPLKGKDILCTISRSHLTVGTKAPSGTPPIVVDGDLHDEVKHEDAMWSLEDCRYVTVTLEKRRRVWWKCALAGGAEIDTQRVDSTCSIEDYDAPTQAAIEKVMFDQEQRRRGLPTSDEMRTNDLLRKAWDAEGSPFKGTPFDPSAVNMSGALPPGL